jgi:hypothetical protein
MTTGNTLTDFKVTPRANSGLLRSSNDSILVTVLELK